MMTLNLPRVGGASVAGALPGGWRAGRCLGLDEELRAQGRFGRAAYASWATGTAGREAALAMIGRSRKTANRTVRGTRVTLGAGKGSGTGKGFDAEDFVLSLKEQNVTPHIAINARTYAPGKIRKTAVDGRATRHEGYAISQRCRKRIEESFGWAKTIGGAAKLKLRGLAKANGFFIFQMIAYTPVRIPKLLANAA